MSAWCAYGARSARQHACYICMCFQSLFSYRRSSSVLQNCISFSRIQPESSMSWRTNGHQLRWKHCCSSDGIARKLWKSLQRDTEENNSCIAFKMTSWGLREISWWSQRWAVVERNRCQHCKINSTTAVPGRRKSGSVDMQTLVPSGSVSVEVWGGRWPWQYLWHYCYKEISILRLTKLSPSQSQKGGLAPKFCSISSPHLNIYVCFSRNTTSVLGVLQLNKGDFVGVLAPQGSTVGVFQLQCLMLIVAFYWMTCCEKLYILYMDTVYVCACTVFFCFIHFTLELPKGIIRISQHRWESSISAPMEC